MKLASDLLQGLGFLINWEKSHPSPTQTLEFLGMILDSPSLAFILPEKKREKTRKLCVQALKNNRIKLRDLAKIMGNFAWAIPAVPFAQAHYRKVQRDLIRALHKNVGDFESCFTLSEEAKADLSWWITNMDSSKGKVIFSGEPDMTIFSDASLTGWGAVFNGSTARGPWSVEDGQRHINELELLAAFFALQSFAATASNISISLQMDNCTAVCYINRGGGTHSRSLSDLATQISSWCESRKITVHASYLPGHLNIVADRESRMGLDSSDWALDQEVFTAINNVWTCQVDLFAAAWNNKLEKFFAWTPQPQATGVDAFSTSWKGLKAYAFPPFGLILRSLAKIRREQASLVLVSPYWPSAAWYPLLLELAVDVARILKPDAKLLTSPSGEAHPLPLCLIAWKLSGNAYKTKAFRRRWSTYCWMGHANPHELLTSRPGTIGSVGASGGILIPCQCL